MFALLSANPATAEVEGTATTAGVKIAITNTMMDRAKNGLDLQTGEPDKRVFEYTSTTACQFSTPEGPQADVMCMGAVMACANNTPAQGQGPQIRLYRRELDASGNPLGGWDYLGTTCSPEMVPGKPVLGMALILAAFHNTRFAIPTVHMQPEGNVTLVTLATYFEVKWRPDGFQPEEIDTVNLMGTPVQIRPIGQGYTYFFGDSASEGPTSSLGGIYPNGDITHTYAKAGAYGSHIDITYGGEFSTDGGGTWLPINDTVTIAGQTQTVTVKTANAHLVIK